MVENKKAFPRIPDEEFVERINSFKEIMGENNFDIVIAYSNLIDPSPVRYFSDFYPINENGALVIPLKGNPILCSGQACHEWSKHTSRIKDIRIMPEVGEVSGVEYEIEVSDFEDLFNELKEKFEINKIGVIGDYTFPQLIYGKIKKVFPHAEIKSMDKFMYELRTSKSENELACIRKAGEIITKAFEYTVPRIKPGVTELDIHADVESQMLRLGAEAHTLSWAPMIPSGQEHSNLCMNRNTLRRVKEGEIIDVQAGVLYEGYNAVICTPVVLGEIPEEIKKAINTAREAKNKVAAMLKPGVTSKQLYKVYSDFLVETGYRKYSPYGSVHSIGMLECESPFFSTNKDIVLVENATVAIDAYFANLPWGSFRIEDTYIVKKDGVELVTTFNKKYLDRYL